MAGTDGEGWDSPVTIGDGVWAALEWASRLLLADVPVPVPQVWRAPPTRRNADYDAIVISDASAFAWAAFVCFPADGSVWLLSEGWAALREHSAWSEPLGATLALRWAKNFLALGVSRPPGVLPARVPSVWRLALVSDHSPLALGQEDGATAFGGFSGNLFNNELFLELYAGRRPGVVASEGRVVFFCPGERNIADGPSRSTRLGQTFSATRLKDFCFPELSSFEFLRKSESDTEERPEWMR